MTTRTVHLCSAKGQGLRMIVDRPGSTAESAIAITDVPSDVTTNDVISKVSFLILWPWDIKKLSWQNIADLRIGSDPRNIA